MAGRRVALQSSEENDRVGELESQMMIEGGVASGGSF